MTCPKCGHEQPDVFSQCQKCRHIFPTRQAIISKKTITDPAAPVPMSNRPSLTAFFGALAGVIVLGSALWWLHSPQGLPVPDSAYVNEKHHFAMSVPPDWMVLTADNYREMFERLGNRFHKSMQEGLSQRRIEVGFLKLLQEADFSPNINVVVMETEIPELDEKQKEEATQALTAQFSRMLDSYKLERSELITVDELTSLQFSSRAGMKFKVAKSEAIYKETIPGWRTTVGETPEEWKTYDLKLIQTLVPGKKRAYIITCTAEISQYPEYRRAFDDAIEAFRVLQRPPRFGSIVMGGMQGGMIGALGYLFYYIVTALIAFIKR